jgi:hypothetical protein
MSLFPFDVRPRFVRALGACALAAGLAGCSGFPFGCTDELGIDVRDPSRTLAVGESFTPRVDEVSCGGRERERADVAWTAEDPTVVRVDPATGRVTALTPGQTRISGEAVGIPVSIAVAVVARR